MRTPSARTPRQLTSPAAIAEDALYARIIKEGIPRTGTARNVAVVGAGVAGLVAASLLSQAGHHVTIYEASQRIGGRIYTVREPFTHGFYGEAGAMRIPSFYTLTTDYIEKFGLPTNTFVNYDVEGNGYIYVNGVKVRQKEYNKNGSAGLGYPLLEGEQLTGQALLTNALAQISAYVGKESLVEWQTDRWKQVIEKYGEYTVREFLKGTTFYSEGAIELIEVMQDLESRTDSSLIQQIVEINDHGKDVEYTEITGGMDQFSEAFLPGLAAAGVEIHKGHRLTAIDRHDGDAGVTLHFERDTAAGGGGEPLAHPTVEADAVIVTIPFPGFRYVRVTPMLSHGKRKAIRELHYDAATKIMLQFKSRFWETNDGIRGGQSITDLPSRFIYYPSHGYGDPNGGVVITSYTWGDEARGWDSQPPEDQIRCSLDDVAAVHGDYVRDEFVMGVVQSWATDRYSYGEAAMFYGGELEELQQYIPTPEGAIHFAGEHTSLKHAWIEGSIESGIRTALEVAGLAGLLVDTAAAEPVAAHPPAA
ncbi:MAG TPA: NAD(P)/FAD-dependent oxidoreductase [Longimicrobium sp.]|nr:NAD(P)/FAD-dependent oxidoreductase [Longimicrobium sp.]